MLSQGFSVLPLVPSWQDAILYCFRSFQSAHKLGAVWEIVRSSGINLPQSIYLAISHATNSDTIGITDHVSSYREQHATLGYRLRGIPLLNRQEQFRSRSDSARCLHKVPTWMAISS
jgi:hypothetical protein